MSSLRRALRAYVLCACSLAVLMLVGVAEMPDLPQIARAFLFGGVAAAAQLRPIHLSSGMKVTAEDAATFAAALTLGPFLSAIVAGSGTLIAPRSTTGEATGLRLFNTATAMLGTGCASFTFGTLAPTGLSLETAWAVVAAGVTKYAVDTLLVDSAVALQLRRNLFDSWWRIHRRDVGPHAALYGLGVVAAVLSATTPWLVLLLALPAALLLLVLAQSARLSVRMQQAVLDLADRVDARDPYTRDHSKRTADLAERLARRMGLDRSQIELVRLAARVHDIGKVGTDDDLLLKRGPLAPSETEEMRRHADIGAKLLSRYPEFWEGAAIVLAHHERPDGKGYPRGLRGSELPLEAAIVSVADAYDAMTNDRPYRRAMRWSQARDEFLRHSGTQWDAQVVATLIDLIDEQERPAPSRALDRPATVLAR
jgi:putative nucleotidyltransferase with HDIG domain